MVETRAKDPERVRLGRLGGLTVAARGRSNTRPARLAWERALDAEYGIDEDLDPQERERRRRAAMRVRMTNLARSRWGHRKAVSEISSPETAAEPDDGPVELPPAA